MKVVLVSILSLFQLATCSNVSKQVEKKDRSLPVEVQREDNLKTAYFASGCFWCVEAIFESVIGVKEAISGYSGGSTKAPTYRQVGAGNTGHAETVEVIYDPKKITFDDLLKVYYGSQNPTTYGQAPDFGSAYRSVVFYQNDQEKKKIEVYKLKIQETYKDKKVNTEILPFQAFWKAEKYHQDYERLNPNYPYVVRVSRPRLLRFQAKYPDLIKK